MKPLKHLNKYLLKYKWRFMLGIVFVMIANFFAIYPAQIIRSAFDTVAVDLSSELITAPIQEQFFTKMIGELMIEKSIGEKLFYFGLLVVLLAILKGIFTFLMRHTLIIMSRLIEYRLKNEVYQHYQLLGTSFYKRNNTGDLMNRISEDVTRVRMYLGPAIMYTVNLTFLFILVIGTMISVNPKLTFYVLTPLPILSITIYYVSNLINRKSEVVQRQLSILTTFTQEAFSGIRVLKAYSRERNSIERFELECNAYKERSMDLVKINALFHPFMILLIGISTLLTIYVGGLEAIAGNISIGNIAEFVIYVNMLTWPVASLGWVTSLVQRASASQERINEFLMEAPEINGNTGSVDKIMGEIIFKDVSYVYPESGIKALDNVSFIVKPGQSLAILGKTGSGKTTISQLINRLIDPSEGSIYVDGKDLKTINLNNLRKNIGYVPQDVFLFSDTIANNIDFENPSNDKAIIEEVVNAAGLNADINILPNGLNTILGERGITLSGGQKQRVSIARAIIKEPKILIFDDCLSAIDTETEDIILNNLVKVMKNKTSIIISHRISSIKHADQIIMIDKGKIIETGTHSSLISYPSEYNKIFQQQLLEREYSI
ncbi:MAG TPA: ABC transporter ATP-binding protein [Flavobacteriales bacterium]|nr:ABC transporter ATP-binding protein [Flavobacteriales bacterium]